MGNCLLIHVRSMNDDTIRELEARPCYDVVHIYLSRPTLFKNYFLKRGCDSVVSGKPRDDLNIRLKRIEKKTMFFKTFILFSFVKFGHEVWSSRTTGRP